MISNAALAGMTYGQAENAYHQGYISQDQWDAYACGWRRSTGHLSSLAAGMEREQSPEVEAIVAEITAAAEERRRSLRFPGFPPIPAIGPEITEIPVNWADACTTETPCPVRAAQGGMSCGH